MNFAQAIAETSFESEQEKVTFQKMAMQFEKGLPDMLYRDPYELHDITGIDNRKWKTFLKLPSIVMLIESELALLSEVKSRSALQKLGDAQINASEVSAIKALLDKSKLLQSKTNDTRTVIFHYIPPTDPEGDLTPNE